MPPTTTAIIVLLRPTTGDHRICKRFTRSLGGELGLTVQFESNFSNADSPGDFVFIHCDFLGNIFVFLLAGEFFRFQYSRGLR